ncbi:MAG: tetrahydrodipicolinate N-succinyltransferase N-terminal domain-containing protein [Candidatus Azotimanducaceae bacterium]|uniref:2,3,4,5-tetrahydropyridine-2,6-dicarboxylate N-succinyltransferase n=1 Tax=OM182 bacterium TaxID=2510334 RepID=A0A520S3Y2_9GAMM|nr:2,3,4,5-tetrahydropyridine-2,6-dicarboxylate N-succinyltransferase [Gammaproteobacteria bacterium]OUV67970.1 MAG: 2,3,4,5-tetrahydropyridine-2,6-dicarboxylate N-succinyltransferase [Gammaproteobacteria bacterium TMED133]RZO77190.1 MAG: 2,3,4,5-tetrahydropyridine-2,6-dicarboxylate N-succinyltransferase [OM182 bacterium]
MFSLAFGVGTKNSDGAWLEIYYPRPLLHPDQSIVDHLSTILDYPEGNYVIDLNDDMIDKLGEITEFEGIVELKESSKPVVLTLLERDSSPKSIPEAYLKLHLLSHRLVKPNTLNLEGIFGILPNVAWTDIGAVDPKELGILQLKARAAGRVLEVSSVDKFPKMTNYVVPSGVRIAHSARVRLGAYLGEGTTVMHEGFVNFNAGALGPNMVEGRISQGVIIKSGTDLGGSASTAGTLSGGGNTLISIGQDCLISANAGTGIPLGDRCTIEAGLYITPGTIVQLIDEHKNKLGIVKARDLAGQSDMLFIRNSQSGIVECRSNLKAIELNEMLHTNN